MGHFWTLLKSVINGSCTWRGDIKIMVYSTRRWLINSLTTLFLQWINLNWINKLIGINSVNRWKLPLPPPLLWALSLLFRLHQRALRMDLDLDTDLLMDEMLLALLPLPLSLYLSMVINRLDLDLTLELKLELLLPFLLLPLLPSLPLLLLLGQHNLHRGLDLNLQMNLMVQLLSKRHTCIDWLGQLNSLYAPFFYSIHEQLMRPNHPALTWYRYDVPTLLLYSPKQPSPVVLPVTIYICII